MDTNDLLERTVIFNTVLSNMLRQMNRLKSERLLGLLDMGGVVGSFDHNFWTDCPLKTSNDVEAHLRKFKDDYLTLLEELGLNRESPFMLDLAGASTDRVQAAFTAALGAGFNQPRRAARSKEGARTRYCEAIDQYLKIPVLVKEATLEPFYIYIEANAFMDKDSGELARIKGSGGTDDIEITRDITLNSSRILQRWEVADDELLFKARGIDEREVLKFVGTSHQALFQQQLYFEHDVMENFIKSYPEIADLPSKQQQCTRGEKMNKRDLCVCKNICLIKHRRARDKWNAPNPSRKAGVE